MDRFGSIVTAAGVACFLLAFLLSGLYPWLITDGSTPETNIATLAEDVSSDFRDLKARWPVAFTAAYPGSEAALTPQQLLDVPEGDPRRAQSEEAWTVAYAKALQDGRDSYVAEGCWHCHSQYVRPVSNEDRRWGPVSTWQQDNNALQRPVLWGTRRVGPDLTYEGGLRSNGWHAAHFWQPTDTSPGSVMPRYPWFYREGFQVRRRIAEDAATNAGLDPETSYALPGVYDTRAQAEEALADARQRFPDDAERLFVEEGRGPNHRGLSLIAYVQWLGTWLPETEEGP